MVYPYRFDRRWAIGPERDGPNVWVFSEITNEAPTGEIIWNENINGESKNQLPDLVDAVF